MALVDSTYNTAGAIFSVGHWLIQLIIQRCYLEHGTLADSAYNTAGASLSVRHWLIQLIIQQVLS